MKPHKILCLSAFVVVFSCVRYTEWTSEELSVINQKDSVMRVLTVNSPDDSLFLRMQCDSISEKMLTSAEYVMLMQKMILTVTSPLQNGVGIAGPQVGIGRRIVAVKRFDKEGNPFEVYPNIRIIAERGEMISGPEGCLSVPNRRDSVLRWRDIDICYTSSYSRTDTVETVTGFTAVIFQHECDHLDGIIYTDRVRRIGNE